MKKVCIILFVTYIIIILYMRYKHPIYVPEYIKDKFYKIMHKFDKICTENDIPYFAICGTLLGSVRHGEMIPWDDDIDVGILEDEFEKFKSIDFSKYGLKCEGIEKHNTGKIFYIDEYDNGVKGESIFIDIFFFKNISGDKYIYSNPEAYISWPNEFFYKSEIFPLKRYKFNNIEINGPSEYIPYCERSWGDWKVPKFKSSLLYPIESIKEYINYYRNSGDM